MTISNKMRPSDFPEYRGLYDAKINTTFQRGTVVNLCSVSTCETRASDSDVVFYISPVHNIVFLDHIVIKRNRGIELPCKFECMPQTGSIIVIDIDGHRHGFQIKDDPYEENDDIKGIHRLERLLEILENLNPAGYCNRIRRLVNVAETEIWVVE